MKFLIDRCAGRRLAEWLRTQGHDVVEARTLGLDPGDEALLAIAKEQERILVTIDTDFGTMIYLHDKAHAGIVHLPDVPAPQRITLMDQLLSSYAQEMTLGTVITVRGGRIRLSRRHPL